MLKCNRDYFNETEICQERFDGTTCMGCFHYPFYYFEHLYLNIFFYSLQFISTGISQFVGLGAEIQKTSILMGLLRYNEYEATNVTYFVSIGSSLTYFFFVIIVYKEANHIDFQAVWLLFPLIVILTDLGNYINRKIYDQIIVIGVIVLEFIWINLLTNRYALKKVDKESQEQSFKTMLEALGDVGRSISDRSLLIQKPQQTRSDLCQVLQIIGTQLLLQLLLLTFRGGNKVKSIFSHEYADFWYWAITIIIYLIGVFIIVFLYRQQNQNYKRKKDDADPNFYNLRSLKENILLLAIGSISIFFSGVAGIGAGLILMPCFILIPNLHMTIQKAINTMVLIQFLIDLCVIMQAFTNYNSLKLPDQFFFLGLGLFSVLAVTLILHCIINKEEQQLRLISIVIGLFVFDICISIYQAVEFSSPNLGANYFSLSIDDCSETCQYKQKIIQ